MNSENENYQHLIQETMEDLIAYWGQSSYMFKGQVLPHSM